MIKFVIIFSLIFITSCASETAKMAHFIDKNNENKFTQKNSDQCKKLIDKSGEEDIIFNSRIGRNTESRPIHRAPMNRRYWMDV